MNVQETQKRIQEAAEKSLWRKMRKPERRTLEERFAVEHANCSDEELYAYAKDKRRKLGSKMTREGTIGYVYLVQRLGPWNVFMGRIGRELTAEKAQTAASLKEE